ncbi:MAG: TonB family protein [Ignavibacteria bacterium]|nr:TonB family protein [Ignavibacteria bacterium]
MAQKAIIAETGPYGGIELKRNYQRYFAIALIIAIVFHVGGLGSYMLIEWLTEEDEPVMMVRLLKYSELGPPPSVADEAAPAVAVSGPQVKPTIGIPVPVPDAEVSPEQTIASQTELSQIGPAVGEGTGGGTQITGDIKIDESVEKEILSDGPPADFVAYEQEPTAVKQVQPKYPDIALRAELEGTVYLKVWVTKEGKVKKAVILKSDAEVFNQAAQDAAMQWVFTPALQQKKPVDVWVAIPFRFRLKDAQK